MTDASMEIVKALKQVGATPKIEYITLMGIRLNSLHLCITLKLVGKRTMITRL